MARYGLPHYDIPGITQIEDLKDPALARRMGEAMEQRMSRGDVVGNLAVTSLVTNAYLLTGEEKYRDWVLEYTDAWIERARQNNGLLPDNIGLSGQVGEYIDGNWYGGLYGWTWPHGFYNVQMAAQVAASNAYLLTQDAGYLDLPRIQIGSHCRTRRSPGCPGGAHEPRRTLDWSVFSVGGATRNLPRSIPLRGCRLVRLSADVTDLPGGALESFDGGRGLGTD